MSELQRVLAALEKGYAWSVETGKGGRPTTEALHDAARVIRELVADLHTALDVYDGAGEINPEWIERVRAKWRLEP